jgi:F-type H+-transporting ATPase subunit b
VNTLLATIGALLAQEHPETEEPIEHLSPQLQELIVGAIAFAVLFFFMWKWVLPRINQTLEARRQKIQGDLEKAEEAKKEAESLLSDYRRQLAGAREEANRVIEEARKTAEEFRRQQEQRAEQENQAIVAKAQEEIRAERDRVFQELKTQVGELSVDLAARMVGESLDRERHLRLVDQYIRELSGVAPSGNGHAESGSEG